MINRLKMKKIKYIFFHLSPHFQGDHQEIIFPVSLIDPVCEIAEEWHRLIVESRS
jgi:hypothetical protein